MPGDVKPGPCNPACTKVIPFYTDHDLPPSVGISTGTYTGIDGYRYINVFVQFSQPTANEPPVDLGVVFAFDQGGKLGARRYANLEENLAGPQSTNFIEVSGTGSWHGSPHNISTYLARFPVFGPFVQVFVYNRAASKRTVSVWGYLVS
jgi:hypothetical protein